MLNDCIVRGMQLTVHGCKACCLTQILFIFLAPFVRTDCVSLSSSRRCFLTGVMTSLVLREVLLTQSILYT